MKIILKYLFLQKKEGQQHQIWYEGHDSLLDKYMYIRSMEVKGKGLIVQYGYEWYYSTGTYFF